MRIRRVGSITCGILMIVFGGLFMVHMFYPALSLALIMKLWPLILIALGSEMLISNIRRGDGHDRMVYELCSQYVLAQRILRNLIFVVLAKGTKMGRILSWFFVLYVIFGQGKPFPKRMEQNDTIFCISYPKTRQIC